MKRFERLGPLAVLTLLVSLLCEGIIISLDLGHPMRVYRFLVTPSFTSMLTWLVVFITGHVAHLPSLVLSSSCGRNSFSGPRIGQEGTRYLPYLAGGERNTRTEIASGIKAGAHPGPHQYPRRFPLLRRAGRLFRRHAEPSSLEQRPHAGSLHDGGVSLGRSPDHRPGLHLSAGTEDMVAPLGRIVRSCSSLS